MGCPGSMAQPALSILAAVADNGVMGYAGRLPWQLPDDLRRFKAITQGKPLLMGRRTWESLPGLLPGRAHWVLTRNQDYRAPGTQVVHSLAEAMESVRTPELMVMGGAELYAECLPLARCLYLTRIHAAPVGDTCFPSYDAGDWREIESIPHPADPRHQFAFTFSTLIRRESFP